MRQSLAERLQVPIILVSGTIDKVLESERGKFSDTLTLTVYVAPSSILVNVINCIMDGISQYV